MECNKDEARRAKEIAEKKFIAKDIVGAKKFALKAQSLYPGIEGVSQMLATFDVFIAVENKVNGESDWYGILGASPLDDDATMKRKYRKLALMLHPDKNKSIGAEGAFKHVAEAWKFLSDKEKRAAYDRKRSLWTVYRKVSASSATTGFCNFSKSSFTTNVKIPSNSVQKPVRAATNGSSQAQNKGQAGSSRAQNAGRAGPSQAQSAGRSGSSQAQHSGRAGPTTSSSFTAKQGTAAPSPSNGSKMDTFWTICLRCMLQYEYLRIYVNRSLLCPNCRQAFLAVERPPPGKSTHWSFGSQKQNQKSATNNSTSGSHNQTNWTFSKTSSAVHAAAVVQKAYEKVKKEREEAQAAARKEECLRKKNAKRRSTESLTGNAPKLRKFNDTCGRKVTYQLRGTRGKLYGTKPDGVPRTGDINGTVATSNVTPDAPSPKIQSPLIEKSKSDICKNVSPEIKSH